MIVSDPTHEVLMRWMPEVFSAPIAEAIRHRQAESANAVAYFHELG
jgi:hypothetical protein